MSHLRNFFENNTSNAINKWIHYFDIYEFWFKKYKNKPIVILEIGVYQGGSLKMWRDYFGEEAKIYAIDINPDCKQFESRNTKIFIGSQEDVEFLNDIKNQLPKFDIIIDDGGHTMNQQKTSFEVLYEHLKDDGLYLCEDLHTSYWDNYGGGYKNQNSFIEYSKNFIDLINAWHSRDSLLKINGFTKSTYALHYYDSVLVLEKKLMPPPVSMMKGEIIIPIENFPTPIFKRNIIKEENKYLKIVKRIIKGSISKSIHVIKKYLKILYSRIQKKNLKNKNLYLKYFKGKNGIEIGGPSVIFSKELPIYQIIDTLDGCNFSNQTIWEGNIIEGENFNYYENKKGYQYICEASKLDAIQNEYYDFIIASHCLEHCANTLKTVKEWLRVIKKGGVILLILPDRRYTFDHKRPVNIFEHFEDDLKNDIDETDLTHLKKILKLHDLTMDLPAGTIEQFKNRSLDNYKNRCLHHHVFDFELLQNIYDYFDIKVVDMTFVKPYHQIILGIKQ